jgi:hypothetical protein
VYENLVEAIFVYEEVIKKCYVGFCVASKATAYFAAGWFFEGLRQEL